MQARLSSKIQIEKAASVEEASPEASVCLFVGLLIRFSVRLPTHSPTYIFMRSRLLQFLRKNNRLGLSQSSWILSA
jgi:hypothetical protein